MRDADTMSAALKAVSVKFGSTFTPSVLMPFCTAWGRFGIWVCVARDGGATEEDGIDAFDTSFRHLLTTLTRRRTHGCSLMRFSDVSARSSRQRTLRDCLP